MWRHTAAMAACMSLLGWGEASSAICTARLAPPRVATNDLTVTYFGVTTLMISDGDERLLVDGFFSRPRTRPLITGRIGSDSKAVRDGLGEGQPPILAILTAHAHHDHALDVAAVATIETSTITLGTPSVARLVEGQGAPPERICVAQEGQRVQLGAYAVTAFYTPHGPSPFFLRWLLDHPLQRPIPSRAWFGRFKDDRNLSFLIEYGSRRVLVIPSAGLNTLARLDADTVFLGIGRLGKMSDADASAYLRGAVSPKTRTLVPIHWDRFTTPLFNPLKPSPRVLDDVAAGIEAVCDFAKNRSEMAVLRIDAGGTLTLPLNGTAIGSENVDEPCRR